MPARACASSWAAVAVVSCSAARRISTPSPQRRAVDERVERRGAATCTGGPLARHHSPATSRWTLAVNSPRVDGASSVVPPNAASSASATAACPGSRSGNTGTSIHPADAQRALPFRAGTPNVGPMRIALALFPRITALDVIGPYEVLQSNPAFELVFVGHE